MIFKFTSRILIPLTICFCIFIYLYDSFISDVLENKLNLEVINLENNNLKKTSRICFDKSYSFDEALHFLKISGYIKNDLSFSILSKLRGERPKVIDGCFYVDKDTTPLDLIKAMESAQFLLKKIEIKPGDYLDYLDHKLRNKMILKRRRALTDELKENRDIYLKQFNITSVNFEGLFFAKTYELPIYFSASSIIRILLNESTNIWNSKFKKEVDRLKLDKNKVLTIASLVSVETNDLKKQRLIANKIVGDSEKNKTLNLDSTLKYSFNLRNRNVNNVLKNKSNPYNTYQIKGLPPGPIGPPTEQSVRVAIDALSKNK